MQDDDEIEEVALDDEEDIDEADDEDDDEDECPGDVSFNMTGKEDPDFSPGIDSIKKAAASQPVRRSARLLNCPILTAILCLEQVSSYRKFYSINVKRS